jgi:hypothetical protein
MDDADIYRRGRLALAAGAAELRRLLDAGVDLLADTRPCPAP